MSKRKEYAVFIDSVSQYNTHYNCYWANTHPEVPTNTTFRTAIKADGITGMKEYEGRLVVLRDTGEIVHRLKSVPIYEIVK